ncbi:hypothetical protein [Bacterioplanoides sp.]|uniref:hypothetical protein n=1 Tax=Bacterioplanoides sp. TaxID=2066072 RepID=UPI003B009772
MTSKLLIILVSAFFSINTYAERIMGHSIPGQDLLSLGQQKTQFRLCPECEAKWHINAKNIKLREYADQITRKQALTLLLNRSHSTTYLGLGEETGKVYYINFGNIEGPFDIQPPKASGGNNDE